MIDLNKDDINSCSNEQDKSYYPKFKSIAISLNRSFKNDYLVVAPADCAHLNGVHAIRHWVVRLNKKRVNVLYSDAADVFFLSEKYSNKTRDIINRYTDAEILFKFNGTYYMYSEKNDCRNYSVNPYEPVNSDLIVIYQKDCGASFFKENFLIKK